MPPRLFYRTIAIAEAVTWTGLITGVPLKYVAEAGGTPLLTRRCRSTSVWTAPAGSMATGAASQPTTRATTPGSVGCCAAC